MSSLHNNRNGLTLVALGYIAFIRDFLLYSTCAVPDMTWVITLCLNTGTLVKK